MIANKRYYAFDSLRATMMFMGLALHSAMTYTGRHEMPFPLKAKETSDVFYFLIYFIHTFRMPVFFLIAGFFGALLFFNKSPEQMVKNRFKRIFLPFLVFLFILYPVIYYAFKYSNAAFNGEIPMTLGELFSSIWNFIPFRLYHLWFLYYLSLISFLVYLFSKLTRRISVSPIDNFFEHTFKNPVYRLLTLTLFSFLILFLFSAKSFETSISWFPNLGVLFYYFVFYITGWLLYIKKELVNTLKRFDIATTVIGVIAFCIKLYYESQLNLISIQIINSIITCTLSIGIIGLFLRFADTSNKYIVYAVNSAYWVYLTHFFITILLPGLINDWTLSPYLKYLIVLTTTTLICLGTYHIFVRKTFIGVFLNGKKQFDSNEKN